MEIKGRVALVTGGTGALGSRLCKALIREGAHVALGYHQSKEDAQKLSTELSSSGPRSIAVQADVSRDEDVIRLVETVMKEFLAASTFSSTMRRTIPGWPFPIWKP